MVDRHKPKVYTVEEAREMIPRLRPMLKQIQELRREVTTHTETLNRTSPEMRQNGHAPEVARLEGRISNCLDAIRERLNEISALDIEVRDLDTGLVDFLGMRHGRIIYLCWSVDEPTVAYWHELNSGFRGRRPLDE